MKSDTEEPLNRTQTQENLNVQDDSTPQKDEQQEVQTVKIASDEEVQNINLKNVIRNSMFYKQHLEKRRWFILLGLCTFSFSNAMCWMTYSGIIDQTQTYYQNASTLKVLLFANIYTYTFLLLSTPISWLMTNYFAFTMIGGAIINCAFCWMRYFSYRHFALAITAQTIQGAVQAVFLQTPVFIADRWFHEKERFTAVTLGVYSNSLGIALGFLLPTLIVPTQKLDSQGQILNSDITNNRVQLLNLIEAFVTIIPLIIVLFSTKNKPKFAPSAVAAIPKEGFFASVKQLMKNKKYLILIVCFSCCLGNSWTITTVINVILANQSYSSIQIGVIGVVFVIAGIVSGLGGTLFITFYQNAKKFFDSIIKFFFVLSSASILAFCLIVTLISSANQIIMILINIILGFGLIGLVPFACESLAEMVFPIDENANINIFYWTSCAISLATVYLSTWSIFGNYGSYVLFATIFPPCIYIVFFFKTDFKRSRQELRKMSQRDLLDD